MAYRAYRGSFGAVGLQLVALFFVGLSGWITITGISNGKWAPALLLGGLFAAPAAWFGWMSWPLCYRAATDDGTLSFTRLTGTRHIRLSEITRFSELAVGDSGSVLHVVHFADGGRVAFDGKRGREFVDYLRRAG